MEYVSRPRVSRAIELRLRKFLAIGVLGPRQVGKTTLVRELLVDELPDAVYLDLQVPSTQRRLGDPETYLRSLTDRIVVIDEVQLRAELFGLLRGLIDEARRPGRFILLGSASPILMRGAAESLAGRISYLELNPLHVLDLAGVVDLRTRWLRGGYPEAVLEDDPELRIQWGLDYVSSFVNRDLAELAAAADGGTMRRLLTMVATSQGSQLTKAKLGASLGVSGQTVNRYLDVLERALLVRELKPWLPSLTKRLTRTPKYYVRDTGLLHTLIGVADQDSLLGHVVAGSSWEGFAIEQIVELLPVGAQPYYYRTAHGAELDLVVELLGGSLLAFEFKLSNAPSLGKGFQQAVTDVRPARCYVVTPEAEPYPVGDLVEVTNLKVILGRLANSSLF